MDHSDSIWTAEMYDSLQAMRLDLQNLFKLDTTKHVENGAQKVGGVARTFYSDVFQDFLPLPCIEMAKADFEDYIGYTIQDSTLVFHNGASDHPLMPPGVVVGDTQSEELCRKSTRGRRSRRSIGIRDIPHLPKSDEPLMPEREDSEELSGERLRQNDDATACDSPHCGLPPAPIDTHEVGSVGDETATSFEDNFDIEVIEAESILEPSEKSRLEESCVLVEGGELDNVSQESKKHKSSYKNKIRSMLSLKLRSPMKQDLFVPNDEGPSDKNDGSEQREPAGPNSCDFGWELL